jgi:hypothetical protein
MGSVPAVQIPIKTLDLTGPGFTSAAAKGQAFSASMNATTYSMTQARGAAMLLGEEVGIKMNRHLVTAMASSELLGKVLSQSFSIVAAVGFLEVAARIPDVLKNAFDVISGTKAEDAMIEANSRLEESLHKIAEKTAVAAAAYERLGKSAELVAVMDKADADFKLISAQAQLMTLKSMLTAQEALSQQTQRVGSGGSFRGGTGYSVQSTSEAKTAQDMVPALTAQISELTNTLPLLKIASATAGKTVDDALTTAFDKASAAAEKFQKAMLKIEEFGFNHRNASLMAAPGQAMLDKAQIPDINAPDWMAGLSNAQTSPLYSGSSAMMNLSKIQTDQSAAVAAAAQIYDETATKAQKYADTLAVLDTLLHQVDASTGKTRISEQQYTVALAQAQAKLDEHSKAWKTIGQDIGKTIGQAALFGESWSKAFKTLLADIIKVVLEVTVFKKLASAFGGKGTVMGDIFGSLAGGMASGGSVSGGMSYLVGEQGPEIFTPGGSGAITPNSGIGGSQTIYNIDARGADVSVEQRIMRLLPIVENRAVARAVASTHELQLRR